MKNEKMVTMIIMRAIPAAGKTTQAKELVAKDPENWVRINRDDFRAMMNGKVHSQRNENIITKMTHDLAYSALKKGINVITDDTNLRQKSVNEWHKIAEKVGNVLVVEKYIDITLKEAIARDENREASVGKAVVKNFYDRYVKGLKIKAETYYPIVARDILYIKQDTTLPKCILVDIDGTIAKMIGRSPFDWSAVHEDAVNWPVHNLLEMVSQSNDYYEYFDSSGVAVDEDFEHVKIIFLSGRDGLARDETIRWFKDKTNFTVTYGDNLFMRAPNDQRRDSIIKDELYEANIKGKYNVLFVLDDRDQMIEHWREVVGLPTFAVEYGDF